MCEFMRPTPSDPLYFVPLFIFFWIYISYKSKLHTNFRCHSHLLETQCFHRENDTMCPTGENHKILLGFESTFSSSWKSGWLHAMLGCGHPMSHVHDPRFRRRRTPDDGPAGSCGCLVKPSGAVILRCLHDLWWPF